MLVLNHTVNKHVFKLYSTKKYISRLVSYKIIIAAIAVFFI